MADQFNEAFLLTGTNLGNRKENLQRAASEIEQKIGSIIDYSLIYETAPWGNTAQPSFFNQVLKVNTYLDAGQLLTNLLDIESDMGRIRKERYGARLIDIDILFFDNLVLQSERLTIPHPRISERNFVLAPLAEIAPDLFHPVLKKTILEIWEECDDTLSVKKISSTNT